MGQFEKLLTGLDGMHQIEPFYAWTGLYDSSRDLQSPFFGKEYNYDLYSESIYGYFIDPAWDFIGSETLYVKILFADYRTGFVIMELFGEWNDTLHNDVMHLKRNVVDHFNGHGITHYILIGENVLNFHGADDCYYEEWFEEVDVGWIAAINFKPYVVEEWKKFNVDSFVNFGGELDVSNWRTLQPAVLFQKVNNIVRHRIPI